MGRIWHIVLLVYPASQDGCAPSNVTVCSGYGQTACVFEFDQRIANGVPGDPVAPSICKGANA